MSIVVPKGFRLAGATGGIKRSGKADVALVVSEHPAVAAGVYTKNLVCAAPVTLNRQRAPGQNIRAVVINSGNANACTGERGLRDAHEMARLAATTCGAAAEQALVMSTGIIGAFLPMEKVAAGVHAAAKQLSSDEESLVAAARAIMTTDTRHKIAGRQLELSGRTIHIAGMAKGAAMIGPNMATMLGLILTDAPLEATAAQRALSNIADETFNCISVDGHMSTNDTVLLLANGAAGGSPLGGLELSQFEAAFLDVCTDLAKAIPADGEGATHLISIEVTGCASRGAARQIAASVANSPLVKTAIAGGDPNWGRIVSAAGYAGVPFEPSGVDLDVNGFPLYRQGAPVDFDEHQVSASIRDSRDTHVLLNFSEGSSQIRFWTTDLTAEYVRLNADYHT